MPSELKKEVPLSSGFIFSRSIAPQSITKLAFPTAPEGIREKKLYWMDCYQCGSKGYGQFPYSACDNCKHDQCDACSSNF